MTCSCTCKRITIALTMFAVTAVASPAAADDVLPGIDLFETPPGSSSDAFNLTAGGTPIPADFFFPGSDPFDGTINLQGNPLGGPFGVADTIVERLLPASLPCPGSDTIPIEIVALDLVSSSPITVTSPGGPTDYDVRVCLSDFPQPSGTMTINHTHSNGGTFDSSLPVLAKFIFTPVVPGPPTVVFDMGAFGVPPDVLSATGVGWVHVPYFGFGIITVPPGASVDRNCDGLLDPPLPGTSNFVPGVSQLQSDCTTPPIDPLNPPPGGPGPVQKKVLTPEQALLAAHGVLPAEQEQLMDCCLPDKSCVAGITAAACAAAGGAILPPGSCTAPEACCLPDGTCITADPVCCLCNGGTPQGAGTTCAPEACCLTDGTCVMLDICACTAQGGTSQGAGSVCGGSVQACCLTDGTCIMADTLCCTAQGGTPQGVDSTCTPIEGCCFPDGTCSDLDPLCCRDKGGVPCGPGLFCKGDGDGNGIDDACEPDHPIPAISNYGLVALLLLTAVAGVIVIRRARRGHAAG